MKTITKIYWLKFALGIVAAFICIGYGFATETIYTNLVVNPSVEGETLQDCHASGPGTVTEWSTNARTGSRSLAINITSGDAEWNGTVKPIRGGATYHVQGYFTGNVSAENQFYLAIRWFSDSEQIGEEENISIPSGNHPQWLQIGRALTAPSNAKRCIIVFKAVNGTGVVYGDDFEVRHTEPMEEFLNGVFLAIIVYIMSYYVLKLLFIRKVEKPRKLFTTGIGIYFLSWLVSWVLLYTLISTYL